MTDAAEPPEAIVGRLAPYAPAFHSALRASVAEARAVFKPRDGIRPPFDPWLFAHVVRWELKQRLVEGLPPGTPLSVEGDTIMSSVVVHLDDLEIRVRKSDPGDVPPPGSSVNMQGWYAQTLDGTISHNLLLLWHTDERHEYAGLDVAFPYDGNAYAPLVHWMVPLPEVVGVADDLDITVPASGETVGRGARDSAR